MTPDDFRRRCLQLALDAGESPEQVASGRAETYDPGDVRRVLLSVLALLVIVGAYPAARFAMAVYDAQVSERTLERCELHSDRPGRTKIISLQRADDGYRCLFLDKDGRILGVVEDP